jgi:hypothetical protein
MPPIARLLVSFVGAPPPHVPPAAALLAPASAPAASALHFTRAAQQCAYAAHRDLPALMARSHPHLALGHRPAFGRCTFAARALPAGATVLREAAFASVRLHAGTRGCDGALVDTLRVYVGDGSAAAALPYFLQQEPNMSAMEELEQQQQQPHAGASSSSNSSSGSSSSSSSAQSLFAPALHRNGFIVGEDLMLSVLLASLTNHSCEPNVASRLGAGQGGGGAPELVFTALRDIAAGEQLLLSYIDCSQGFAARRERLTAGFGFHCACARCVREALEDPSPCACAACLAAAPSSTF